MYKSCHHHKSIFNTSPVWDTYEQGRKRLKRQVCLTYLFCTNPTSPVGVANSNPSLNQSMIHAQTGYSLTFVLNKLFIQEALFMHAFRCIEQNADYLGMVQQFHWGSLLQLQGPKDWAPLMKVQLQVLAQGRLMINLYTQTQQIGHKGHLNTDLNTVCPPVSKSVVYTVIKRKL